LLADDNRRAVFGADSDQLVTIGADIMGNGRHTAALTISRFRA
jgi:hypothetical protein